MRSGHERSRQTVSDAKLCADGPAALYHTWFDSPIVPVFAAMLLSFRATQHPSCALMIVWTPALGTHNSTEESARLTNLVLARESGGPRRAVVRFEVLDLAAASSSVKRPLDEFCGAWSQRKP